MTDPKLEAHLRASNRLLRRAADLLDPHHDAPKPDRLKLLRQIDNHLERSREL